MPRHNLRDPITKRFISNMNGSTKPNGRPKKQPTPWEKELILAELIGNTASSRQRFVEQFLDPRRNIDDECGYPSTENITDEMYRRLYDRESIATRVVEVLPRESWQIVPMVFEDEDPEVSTPFEAAWADLDNKLRATGGPSWYQDEEGSPIWEYLSRTDLVSGIGHYGVLLMGFDDGETDLKNPVKRRKGLNLTFLRSFDESLVDITRWESDRTKPRFGLPLEYMITLNDPKDQPTGTGVSTATINVHWSRVIHVADNLTSSEVFGVPRMRPVYNRLYDLRKLYGGSAEMYWKGAFPGISFETHPQLGGDVEVDTDKVTEAAERYQNTLQRFLITSGMSAKSLSPQVSDPSSQIDKELEAICIVIGIPKRIFMGSERGQLASGQDDDTWTDRIHHRQSNYITPRIIVPFIDRLIQVGVLPEPDGYSVKWPHERELNPQEQADLAVKRTEALSKYIGGGVDTLIQPMDYLIRVVGMEEEEAKQILEATQKVNEQEEAEQKKAMEEQTELQRKGEASLPSKQEEEA